MWFFDTPETPGGASIVERIFFESKQPLWGSIFETGAYDVPSKSQNQTVWDQGYRVIHHKLDETKLLLCLFHAS